MEDSLYDLVMRELEAARGSWPTVAQGSGVPFSTVVKIARREIKDPGISHIEKLARYFRGNREGHSPSNELRV